MKSGIFLLKSRLLREDCSIHVAHDYSAHICTGRLQLPICNTKFIMFNRKFVVSNGKFIVLNTEFIIFTDLKIAIGDPASRPVIFGIISGV